MMFDTGQKFRISYCSNFGGLSAQYHICLNFHIFLPSVGLRYNNLKTKATLKQVSDFALDSSKASDRIDIFSCAWGPSLYGRYIRYLDAGTKLAMKTIAEEVNKTTDIRLHFALRGSALHFPSD